MSGPRWPVPVALAGCAACGVAALLFAGRRCPRTKKPRASARKRRLVVASPQAVAQQRPAAAATPSAAAQLPLIFHRYAPLRVANTSSLAGGDAVSIMSWNILSDTLAHPKRLPWVAPGVLEWRSRASQLASELQAASPDVVALQEVEAARWDEVRGWLPGWEGLLQDAGGRGSEGGGKKEAMLLALLWKPHMQLVWSEHRSRALLAQLRFTGPSGHPQDLWVVNVHLEGSPYRPNDRVSQLRNALARLEARQRAVGCIPETAHVVLCGDFNSGRGDTPWRLLQSGRLEAGATESYLSDVEVTKTDISHPYAGLQDCYAAAGSPVPWTRKAPGVAATIDFVWASAPLTVIGVYDALRGSKQPPPVWLPATRGRSRRLDEAPSVKLMEIAEPNTDAVAGAGAEHVAVAGGSGRALAAACKGNRTGLPHAYCPSDHLPLGVVLRLPPGCSADVAAKGEQAGRGLPASDSGMHRAGASLPGSAVSLTSIAEANNGA